MKKILLAMFNLCLFSLCPLTADAQWVGTWATSVEGPITNDMPKTSLAGKTLVQIIHVSLGGETLRLQLSNEFGSAPVEIERVWVGNKIVKFNGKKKITIPSKETVFSDDFSFSLQPLQRLEIKIKYGKNVPDVATCHRGSRTTSYIYDGKEMVEKVDHWYNIAALDVKSDDAYSIVCLGNSITDGRGSITNEQNRWTDFLAEALGGKVGVLNQGIGGNAVIRGGLSEPALKRFDRDIIPMREAKVLIIFEGVNDIGGGQNAGNLINAYKELITKGHKNGMKVLMATITPFKGNSYYTEEHEKVRKEVNEWIRNSKGQTLESSDGIIDFDMMVRDSADNDKLIQAYSDDWLHLNPRGYEAMGKYAAECLTNYLRIVK